MTQSITYGGVDIAGHIKLPDGITGMTSHADGTFGAGEALLDDGAGIFNLVSLQEFIHEESACSQPRTFTGFLVRRTLSRGSQVPGSGRDHDLDIVDLNYLLHLQPLRGATAKRPVETGDDRMDWLMASVALDGIVFDNGLIGSNTNLFDEADYTLQYADDVLQDLSVSSSAEVGRIFFVYRDSTSGEPSLFMDRPTATSYTSTLSISNDLSDLSDTCFPPYMDAELQSSGEDIYCSVFFKYKTGTVYRHNDTTHATYFASKGYHRQGVFETSRIGSEATAIRHADAWLANHSGDLDTITCQIQLPADKVNLIEAGMRVQCKFTHFPGYDSFGYLRVSSRTVGLEPVNDLYLVRLELSNRTLTPTEGGPAPGDFPHSPPPCSTATLVQWTETSTSVGDPVLTFGTDVTPGNLIVAAIVFHDNQPSLNMPTMTDWTMTSNSPISVPNADGSDNADGTMAMFYRFAGADGDSYTIEDISISTRIVLMEFSGGWVVGANDDDGASGTSGNTAFPAPLGSVAVTGESLVVGIAIWSAPALGGTCTIDRGTVITDGDPGGQGPPLGVSWEAVSTAGTVAPTMTLNTFFTATNGHAGMIQAFSCSSTPADNPPASGQVVPWETVTVTPGSTTSTGTTTYPYADNTLQIKVDGVLLTTASYEETDPATGAFTLLWVIDGDETVTATYLGR